jgi:sugar phosphate isomerase/epimerase
MRSRYRRNCSRRDILRLGAAGLTTACAARFRFSSAAARIPIGVQLFSVRHDCARDLAATLEAVSRLGYTGVEFAGYYERSAAELRKLLDENALACCGTHIALKTLMGDNLAPTVEFNAILGNRFLVVPALPPERRSSRQNWLETARIFNEISAKLETAGMRIGYHNHSFEFRQLDGATPWDTFFGNTRKEVFMQMDIGNAVDGGADPVAFIRKYPGRALTVHVRESSRSNPQAYVGEGDVNWQQVFDTLEKDGGTEWYIVEYDAARVPAVLEGVARCLVNLRKLGR